MGFLLCYIVLNSLKGQSKNTNIFKSFILLSWKRHVASMGLIWSPAYEFILIIRVIHKECA